MKMSLNKLATLTALMVLPLSAMAAPTVTFEGEVTSQTCSVSINGQTNSIVMLPTVAIKDFGEPLAAAKTAGFTPFTISITDCQKPEADANITTKFLGYNVDSDSGVLGNTRTGDGAANGFGIQLMKDSQNSDSSKVNLKGVTSVPGLVLKAGETSASYDFGVRYYSLSDKGTPGKITAVAEYTVSYL